MGSAFTPGLTITEFATIRKTRRLPVQGDVLASVGDHVEADTVVARVDIPGTLAVAKAMQSLGCAAEQLQAFCIVKEGDAVRREQVLAERSVFFGLFTSRCRSPRDGTVEYISKLSGNIGIRGEARPVTRTAYVTGIVVEVLPNEGVVEETTGAYIQGIFGVAGERHGELCWLDNAKDELTAADITPDHRGRILMHPGRIEGSALTAAAEHGVVGLVGAGMIDDELMAYLGFDIGVAITGEERIPFSVILTEGFGRMRMPERTSTLLAALTGSRAAINGATQIRAGVIRPEIIVPRAGQNTAPVAQVLPMEIGARVRLIRRPGFGKIGRVVDLPDAPVVIGTGSQVRVLTVVLEDGTTVTIPRANVEILEGAAQNG